MLEARSGAGMGVEGGGVADRHEGAAGERGGRGRVGVRHRLCLDAMAPQARAGQVQAGESPSLVPVDHNAPKSITHPAH